MTEDTKSIRKPRTLSSSEVTDITNMRDIASTLWRKRYIIFMIMALFITSAYAIVQNMPSQYEASAKVLVEPRSSSVINFEKVVSGLAPDSEIVLSQVEVIRSRGVIREVIEDMALHERPEFNPDLGKEKRLQTHMPLTPENIRVAEDILLSKLTITPIGRSLVIRIKIKHTDPDMAQALANTIADTYIDNQIQTKFVAKERVVSWLEQRVKDLADKVRASSEAVEIYRTENNLIDGYKAEVTSQQLSEINTEYVKAQSYLTEVEADLKQLRHAIAAKKDLGSLPKVVDNYLVNLLKKEQSEAEEAYSEVKGRYGKKHPRLIEAKAKISQIEKKIEKEIKIVTDSLEKEAESAKDRVIELQGKVSNLEERKSSENFVTIRLRELERQANTDRMVYENYLKRLKESEHTKDIERADARIISYAARPLYPTSPNRIAIFIISAFAGAFFSMIMVFFLEQFDHTYRTPRHLEDAYNIPTLTMIPIVDRKDPKRIGDYIIDKPYSSIAETIRALRVSLMMHRPKNLNKKTQGHVLSLTSSMPGEGKTTVAVWLSRSLAVAGNKTLLVDCDLRRPNVHKFFGDSNAVSLIDVLRGKAAPEKLISIDKETGLHRIYSKPMQKGDADILSTDNMQLLISSLRDSYDYIILDSPPCLAVSDSRVVAKLADQTLYVVQWNKTPREVVHSGLNQMHKDNIEVGGFVISQVDLKRHSKYNYGDMSHYYFKHHGYFLDQKT